MPSTEASAAAATPAGDGVRGAPPPSPRRSQDRSQDRSQGQSQGQSEDRSQAAGALSVVSLAEMRAFLKIDGADEDGVATGLIEAALDYLERRHGIVALESERRAFFRPSASSSRIVALPLTPVASVTRILDRSDDVAVELKAGLWRAELDAQPAEIVFADLHDDVEIVYRAGFGSSSIPPSLRLAVKTLVAHWFETRLDLAGDVATSAAGNADALILPLIAPWRRRGL